MDPSTIFSWGYWGWGNTTRELVEAVDAAEQSRGFEPPLFVDIRISRSVRAVGFRDHAFERLVGQERYVWLRSLGNRHVETGTGPRIQIADPSAAGELLARVQKEREHRRRLVFFCSCELPINEHGEECHRVTVAKLVREVAAARGVAMQVMEWPGGEPETISLSVPLPIFRAVKRGRSTLPLAESIPLAELARLAWGSEVRLRSSDDELVFVSGPVRFQGGSWCLPVLQVFTAAEADTTVPKQWAAQFRRAHGYQTEETVVPQLSPSSVYTIAHLDKLRDIEERGGSGALSESKPWTSAQKL